MDRRSFLRMAALAPAIAIVKPKLPDWHFRYDVPKDFLFISTPKGENWIYRRFYGEINNGFVTVIDHWERDSEI